MLANGSGRIVATGDIGNLAWLAVRIAVVVAIVVLPFGYAITAIHTDVSMGVGCGVAIGVGVGLRGGPRSGPWTGILIGSIIGVATSLIAGLVPGDPYGFLVPPVLALAVGLIAGLRGSSLRRYRDVSREALVVAVLLGMGLLPAWIAQGHFASGFFSVGTRLLAFTLLWSAWTALVAGFLSHRREGWLDTRHPLSLLISAVALPVVVAVALPILLVVGPTTTILETGSEPAGIGVILTTALVLLVAFLGLPAAAFVLGRSAITWLEPRFRVYGYLADYLRVMWVPIGAFGVGYMTIIVLFAGFYGVLERFWPNSFAHAGSGLGDWLSFAFFTALGQDFTTADPVSTGAKVLVGTHLMLSASWAVVMFAAVMSSIGPRLDEIARRHAESADTI